MIIDGVKWACDACIRGHRVSGCTHSDRELKQIAKKGRPVSQCPHCRHLRKSRSAHVKCDCGERHTSKDHTIKKPVAGVCCNGTGEKNTAVKTSSSPQCSCCHGGRCTCALKTDVALETVPELPSGLGLNGMPMTVPLPPIDNRRPKLQATQSESSLTTFANGHHKPTHKSYHGVHTISPYTIQGHADHHRHSFLDDDDMQAPVSRHRRMKSGNSSSSDLLSLSSLGLRTRSNSIVALEQLPLEQTPRQPMSRQTLGRSQTGLSVNTNQAQFSYHDNFGHDFLQSASADSDAHQFSAGLHPSNGWPSLANIDLDSLYPGLTSSSSVDDNDENSIMTAEFARSLTNTGPVPSEASDIGDDNYRLSATSSFIGMPHTGLLGGNRLDEYSMERYLVDFLSTPMETTRMTLERYLCDGSPQQPFMDPASNLTLSGDASPYDPDQSLFANPYIGQQTIYESSENLADLFPSNIHSPSDSNILLSMTTPAPPDDEGLVWMRKFSNASSSAYPNNIDQAWNTQSQSQSPQ